MPSIVLSVYRGESTQGEYGAQLQSGSLGSLAFWYLHL